AKAWVQPWATYFNQQRIIGHVKHATASGTIPTRRFFPSHGRTINWRSAILLNAPLVKIQPACKPIGSQSERVRNRASVRIQPIKNKVVNPAATKSGSANWTNACAIELNHDIQVTFGDVRSGAFKK